MILLVRPRPHPDSVGLQSFMVCEPLELEYAYAALAAEGHSCQVVDKMFDNRSWAQLLAEYNPRLICFTAYIVHVGVVKEYARSIKDIDSSIQTVVGGVHAEVVPSDFTDPAIDFIIHAQGIRTLVALARRTQQDVETIRQLIPGLWNGPAKAYPQAPEFAPLPPHRSSTQAYRHRYNYIFHNRCALLKTSLGCAYGCDFCFCRKITRHQLLERDLDDVISEIAGIAEKNIFIVDDNFLFRPERVQLFCDKLEQAKLHKNFLVFGRADFIAQHSGTLRRFRECGLQAVFMGLESFSNEELTDLKKLTDVETNVAAVQCLAELGIECHCGIIVSPDWAKKDFANMVAWLKRLGRPFVNIQPLTPMPGTPLYERMASQIRIPRERYELWDMTHLVLPPTRMSPRRFWWQIIVAYYKTTTSWRNHWHILRRYGFAVYRRTAWGSLHLTWQYLRILWKGP